ncbi:PQQ-like beta-propeller repeat protein [Actinotalea sp. M2MS4P-6]|uniref:PQQ-like beta-propeller repeat protein n=1 Tax=Actinotalea sp. M2MS4P-6 TaxID=2983762 RepID=UPI0021E439F3|nr:PQQ-like beta-propeller repeat protein [Actinotalea sp. M2MS4P-6]MCV2394924.1 PQQ-like beta-propeller repeat protein [Actinotalea sp. M2MS4P-6]
MARDDQVDVLLDEEAGSGPPRPGSPGTGIAVPRVPAWARSAAVWAAVLAVLLAGVSVAAGRQVATTAARLSGAVALTGSLAAPWSTRWSADATSVLGATGAVLVTVDPDDTLRGLRTADGTELWSVPVPVGQGSCLLAGRTPVCSSVSAAGQTSVIALDPVSGAVLQRLDWATAAVLDLPVEDDVVLVGSGDEGRVAAVRWSPATGATVWTFASAPDVVWPQQTTWETGTDRVRVTSHGQVTFSLVSGADLGAAPVDVDRSVTVPAGDALAARLRLRVDAADLERLEPDGAVSWAYRFTASGGTPAVPLLTVDGVLVCGVGATLVGLDAADGTELWTLPSGLTQGASAVTDGWSVATTLGDGSRAALVSMDPRTGQVRWRVGLGETPVARLVVLPDGSVLVATVDEIRVLGPG